MILHDCQVLFKADLVALIKMGQQHDGQVLR